MKRNLLVFIFLSFFVHVTQSANTELKIQHWQANHGLPSSPVIAFSENEAGFLILHCANASYRFDGESIYPVQHQFKSLQTANVQISNGQLKIGQKLVSGTFTQLLKSKDKIWVTGTSGLAEVDTTEQRVKWLNRYEDLPENQCSLPTLAPDGNIWFAMRLLGVGFYNPTEKAFYSIKNINKYDAYINGHQVFSELLDRSITSLYFDRFSNLWIATETDGLYKISFQPQRFQFFRMEFTKEVALPHRDISFPLVTDAGDVWISTWGGGINVWDKSELNKAKPTFKSIPVKLKGNKRFPDLHIFPLMEDSRKNIWIGTRSGGLFMISHKNRENKNYVYQSFNRANGKLPFDEIGSFCEGKNKDIWCGTYRGLVHIDADFNTKTVFEELENPNLFKNTDICLVRYTKEGKLWIASRNNYLYLWDQNTQKVDSFHIAYNSTPGVALNHVNVDGTDWFSGSVGLCYYDKIDRQIRFFMRNNQLPGLQSESILSDENGMLWLGSANGLSKVNPITNEVKTFDLPGGTMGSNFTQGASKGKLGYMYFGSRYGLYRFHPRNVEQEPRQMPIIFTRIGISGETFSLESITKSKHWKQNEDGSEYLRLKHNENTISIDFLKLDYEKEADCVFEVILEGNDQQWLETSDAHRTWSRLSPGVYTFKVREKGMNNLTAFRFEILPPWWGTWPAFFAYILTALLVFILLYRLISKRAKTKEKRRQKEKYDQLRFRFFLNISHEIRTPLTLINGAIDRLVSEEQAAENKELNRIQYNTGRLIRMVNEVLDLKKIEQSEVEVKNTFFNLKEFLESTVDAFRLREDKFRISLKMPETPVWINSGRELLETVLYNLLSNAIKFSDDGGRIDVLLEAYENSCVISVQDFGVGMSEEEQQQIFERFYKQDKNEAYGTGIGLSLVKEFVDLLGGNISVKSKLGKGSCFSLSLPMETQTHSEEKVDIASSEGRPQLLIVDDHADIRSFIAEIFADKFSCIEATNGKEALEMAKAHSPEIVISDVMMPEMNGFELCEKLKENLETSHIPIILLTAKTGVEAELKAATCNADAFVSKPFQEKLLKARVEQLVVQRKKLRELFSGQNIDQEETLELNPIDQEFIEKLEHEIETRIDDSDFGVEDLASAVALSSSGLYRKIKALTDQSPVEFIRTFRLKMAASLLKETRNSVTEIADKTGFGTQKYFSRCFKEKYGMSPLQYRKSKS